MVDEFGHPKAFEQNVEIEYYRNGERYDFLKWGSKSLDNFKAVPPGTGICHQVNLEHIAQAVWSSEDGDGQTVAYPDTCVGTDSHTTMINGLGVLGWGVGGIEAEAAMLGQPVSMLIPEVVGFKLTGKLKEGVTATDLVLTATQMLRAKGVVGRFVGYYGPGLDSLSLADRATLANMAPEYGATCGFFGIDDKTLDYMRLTGRSEETIALVETYAKAQGLLPHAGSPEPVFPDPPDPYPPHPRQYGARIWRDLRLLRHRRQDARLYAPDRPQRREYRAGRDLCQGAGPVAPRGDARSRLHRHARSRHGERRPQPRRPEAPAGQGRADRGRRRVQHRPQESLWQGQAGARPGRGQGSRHRRRRRGDRRDHELHQHLEPRRHDRRRSCRQESERARHEAEAMGQDQSRAGVAGRHRLSGQGGPAGSSRRDRLQSRRLWLHDLHRQFGSAGGADLGRDPRQRHRRRLGAVGQPQFRGPRVARRARQLPRLAAARRRLCAQGHGDRGFHRHPDRAGQGRKGRVPRPQLDDQTGRRRRTTGRGRPTK